VSGHGLPCGHLMLEEHSVGLLAAPQPVPQDGSPVCLDHGNRLKTGLPMRPTAELLHADLQGGRRSRGKHGGLTVATASVLANAATATFIMLATGFGPIVPALSNPSGRNRHA